MLQVNSIFVIFIDQYPVVCMCSFIDLIQIERYLTSKLSNNNLTFWAKYSAEGKDCRIKTALSNVESSIYVYIPGPPFQCTPTPSPPQGRGGSSHSLKKEAWGMYTYILPNQIIWWPWNDLAMTLTFSIILMFELYFTHFILSGHTYH